MCMVIRHLDIKSMHNEKGCAHANVCVQKICSHESAPSYIHISILWMRSQMYLVQRPEAF